MLYQINPMKKTILAGLLVFLFAPSVNAQVNSKLQAYAKQISYNKLKQPSFITFKSTPQVEEANVAEFINSVVLEGGINKVAVLKTDKDAYGFTTIRYSIVQNNIPLYNKVIIAHCREGKLVSLNGDMVSYAKPGNQFGISEKEALNFALKKVNAKSYMWENKAEEESMRKMLNKPDFSYYPTGTKVIFEKDGKLNLAYQFTIYAKVPLYRAYVFVDASSGKILGEQSLICNSDVPATVNTVYSGVRNVTCDQQSPTSFRLKESARGQGIATYNMNNTTTYSSTDFTNTSSTWNVTTVDQAAGDAHWGAESTYDFYYNKFNINSIDNAGYPLNSYIHYDTQFDNAFWNGICMTYGDGDGSNFTIFTALDICGHEITHGLVSNTAQLGGGGTAECDALNEGFADIFGTSIERYARSNNWNWIIGLDIDLTGTGFRNMSNPNSINGQPDTYMGQGWDTNGEPHNNNGPCIYWFYLLVSGGSGTNDNGDAYNVTGIGNVDAEKIAYRALTTYFTPSTAYADARVAALQAAEDLFGTCSVQFEQTVNAWYAVGVGTSYNSSFIGVDFIANNTTFCSLPATVNFTNTTLSGTSYNWSFGDGAASTSTNASHTYTASGSYNVKLTATGCINGSDTLVRNGYIVVGVPSQPTALPGKICGPGQVALTASGNGLLNWYASPNPTAILGTGTSFVTPTISTSTTFYVVNVSGVAYASGGLPTFMNGSILYDPLQALTFDVLQNSTLNTVQVYALSPGNCTFQMRDASGSVLYSTIILLTQGSNTLTLNFPLSPGIGYQLGMDPGAGTDLFRTYSGVSYPYSVGNYVNITGSTSGASSYYWFYDWKVTRQGCGSQPVAVTASIIPLPVVSITTPVADSICSANAPMVLSANPSGGSFSGSGVLGSTFDPSSANIGHQSVFYIYTDPNDGCTNTDSVAMNVSICTGIVSQSLNTDDLSIYPNPFTDQLIIRAAFNGQAQVTMTDATGRLIVKHILASNEETLSLVNLPQGLYFVTIQDQANKIIKTLKVVKE